jgi:hypothetical protein
MKKVSLLVFLSLSALLSFAQQDPCPPGGNFVTCRTQEDVNQFAIDYPNPTFPHSVTFTGRLDLSGLSYLTSIEGCLNLSFIHSLDGLQNLQTVGRQLTVQYSNTISNFDQLRSLSNIGSLYITDNSQITKLPHFDNTTMVVYASHF